MEKEKNGVKNSVEEQGMVLMSSVVFEWQRTENNRECKKKKGEEEKRTKYNKYEP